jgi:hypothetical protein
MGIFFALFYAVSFSGRKFPAPAIGHDTHLYQEIRQRRLNGEEA